MMRMPLSAFNSPGGARTSPPPTEDAPWLTLQDILQTNPVESQAETILLRNIMETVANETTAENAMNILESISDEALHLYTTSPMPDATHQRPQGDLLDIFSSAATSPRSPDVLMHHKTIARPSRVLRYASHSPPPTLPVGRIPKKSSSVTVSAKQPRPSQLATMAQRWDAFQHVSMHPSKKKMMYAPSSVERSNGEEEIQQPVPSAAEIMVLQSWHLDGRRRPSSIHNMRAASTSPPEALSIVPPQDLPEVVMASTPESLKLYKKTDAFVEQAEPRDGMGHDVECGSASTNSPLNGFKQEEKIVRRWGQCWAWCTSQIQKPPSHPKLFLQHLLPPKQQHSIWNDFEIFIEQRRDTFFHYARFFLWIVVPALIVAFILYYFAGKNVFGIFQF